MKHTKSKPIIGITMGDPAGIGPEIVVKALSHKEVYQACVPVVIGDKGVMTRALGIAKKDLKIHVIDSLARRRSEFGVIDVYGFNRQGLARVVYGKVSAAAGKAAGDCIKLVIKLALAKKIDATVTAPIHKHSLNLGGYRYPGHTEFYADVTRAEHYNMLLVHDNLRVIHVTTHVSLRDACSLISRDNVYSAITQAFAACNRLFGILRPRIAVLGLNPHAGDDGLFGNEERDKIAPAIKNARALGMDVEGPLPPDTAFSKAAGGRYDIVVAMYHDQGHIPLKLLGFKWNEKVGDWDQVAGVNITLGLPIVRVSVDHGVAFGKAGKGIASPSSLLEAIFTAASIAGCNAKSS
jgi:4-hydroxythreonine-4-phosphate dehydrogenase